MAMNDMGMGAGAMADEDQMAPAGQNDTPQPQQEGDEPISVFLSKASLPAGKKYQEGDTITLKVESIDPENGDIEACISEDGQGNNHEQYGEGPSMKGFDAAIPETE